VQCGRADVHPVEHLLAGRPDRALAQLGAGVENALHVDHQAAPSSCFSLSSMRRWMSSASSSQPNTQTVAIPSNDGRAGREELRPVDVAVADLVVLVDPGIDPGRVHDVAVADVRAVVEAVRDVQVLQLAARVLHHPAQVADAVREVERVRRAEHVVHPRPG
jgi:hypothetical protein